MCRMHKRRANLTTRNLSRDTTVIFVFLGLLSMPAVAQRRYTTWSTYLGDDDSSHYSALKQISRSNVTKLQVAWTYPTDDQVTYLFNPIVVGHTMYVLAKDFSVVALAAATGRAIWVHKTRSPHAPAITAADGGWGLKHRGINYWQSKTGSDRRLILPIDQRIEEIDARTGLSI